MQKLKNEESRFYYTDSFCMVRISNGRRYSFILDEELGRWIPGSPPPPRPIRISGHGGNVLVVNGEDRYSRWEKEDFLPHGCNAVCTTPFGFMSYAKNDYSPLVGRSVVILANEKVLEFAIRMAHAMMDQGQNRELIRIKKER